MLFRSGLVYAALATAAASGSAFCGALFMMLFGLGTLPVLLMISLGGWKLNLSTRKAAAHVLPLATLVTATLLILRGMNLGIPYISPTLEQSSKVSCCNEHG